MSDPFRHGSHLSGGGNSLGNWIDSENAAEGVPMVDIIDIRAELGVEILHDCIGKSLAGFDVLLTSFLPLILPLQSVKFLCRGCVLIEREVRIRREKLDDVRVGHWVLVDSAMDGVPQPECVQKQGGTCPECLPCPRSCLDSHAGI